MSGNTIGEVLEGYKRYDVAGVADRIGVRYQSLQISGRPVRHHPKKRRYVDGEKI